MLCCLRTFFLTFGGFGSDAGEEDELLFFAVSLRDGDGLSLTVRIFGVGEDEELDLFLDLPGGGDGDMMVNW